jgi:hypothetical protein
MRMTGSAQALIPPAAEVGSGAKIRLSAKGRPCSKRTES